MEQDNVYKDIWQDFEKGKFTPSKDKVKEIMVAQQAGIRSALFF